MADVARRRIAADCVLLTYCWCEVLRLLAEGADRADASAAGWALFGQLVQAATGMTLAEPANPVATPTDCLSQSAGAVRDALAMDWATFHAAHPTVRASVTMDEDTIGTMIWLTDTMARVSHGVGVLDAAAQAHAAFAGKPRRRRKPADAPWLTTEISTVQQTAWAALADQQPYRRPVITGFPVGRLPHDPPAATVATTERG